MLILTRKLGEVLYFGENLLSSDLEGTYQYKVRLISLKVGMVEVEVEEYGEDDIRDLMILEEDYVEIGCVRMYYKGPHNHDKTYATGVRVFGFEECDEEGYPIEDRRMQKMEIFRDNVRSRK